MAYEKKIHHEQVKFISGMQDLFNIWEYTNTIYHLRLKEGNHTIFSLGAEQSFHRSDTQSL